MMDESDKASRNLSEDMQKGGSTRNTEIGVHPKEAISRMSDAYSMEDEEILDLMATRVSDLAQKMTLMETQLEHQRRINRKLRNVVGHHSNIGERALDIAQELEDFLGRKESNNLKRTSTSRFIKSDGDDWHSITDELYHLNDSIRYVLEKDTASVDLGQDDIQALKKRVDLLARIMREFGRNVAVGPKTNERAAREMVEWTDKSGEDLEVLRRNVDGMERRIERLEEMSKNLEDLKKQVQQKHTPKQAVESLAEQEKQLRKAGRKAEDTILSHDEMDFEKPGVWIMEAEAFSKCADALESLRKSAS